MTIPNNTNLIELNNTILYKVSIKGIETISSVDIKNEQHVMSYDDDNEPKIDKEHVLMTAGIDLNYIKSIKGIDYNKTFINDIQQTYINFGIEAARNLIIKEIYDLYNNSGNEVGYTHVALLADVMTNNGAIISIDRYGLNRLDTDPLSRATFEQPIDQLLEAAVFNEVDHLRSVSSRIMIGKTIRGGTGLCDVLIDNDILENTEYNTNINSKAKTTHNFINNPVINDIIQREEHDVILFD